MSDGPSGGRSTDPGDPDDPDDPGERDEAREPCELGDDGRSAVEQLVMEATYRALRTHGYADLSVAHIAEEFEKSKSLLYYHYDSKDDLVEAFLRFAGDRFLATLDAAERDADGPVETLRRFVDVLLAADPDDERADAQRAMIDLRAQAVSEPRFRAEFTRIDDDLRGRIRRAVADGVETGALDPAVDPDPAAAWLLASLTGAMLQRHTADYDVVTPVRATLHDRLDELAAAANTE